MHKEDVFLGKTQTSQQLIAVGRELGQEYANSVSRDLHRSPSSFLQYVRLLLSFLFGYTFVDVLETLGIILFFVLIFRWHSIFSPIDELAILCAYLLWKSLK
jgi:hypothetical protein